MIYANDFTFCDSKLSDYGYIIAAIDNSASIENTSCGNIEILTEKPIQNKKDISHGFKYGEGITLSFQIVKMDKLSHTPAPVTNEEYENIMRWLIRPTYNYITFDTDDNLFFHVKIKADAIKIGNIVHGFELTLTNDSAYGYSKEYITRIGNHGTGYLEDESSLIGYTYPKLQISIVDSGTYTLTNDLEPNRSLRINNCTAGEVITIDCENKTITSNKPDHDLAKDFNFTFFRFLNTYDNNLNKITSANGSVDMTYRFTRMVSI
ncbi:MAG: hypothetical protein HFJ09_07100 [Lachnospiraceae bacterium]|nr:hypothetical protein [Lachnospiraceae bacterium]